MTAKQQEGWEVALNLLNDNVNEIKGDVKDIKSDIGDLKTDVAVLKSQDKTSTVDGLTLRVQAIEVRNTERDANTKWTFDRLSTYAALAIALITAVFTAFVHR
jgi:hypothetical protein